jgi:hypothetical protein
MPRPITPSGRPRELYDSFIGGDVVDRARQQDEERRIQEDNIHFQRTGENRPPIYEINPLVDNDMPNVANDGDTYDDNSTPPLTGYAEDSPTQIVDPDNPRRRLNNQNRRNNTATTSMPNNRGMIPSSAQAREAYLQREQVVEDIKFREKADKNKKKHRNAISGLDLGD